MPSAATAEPARNTRRVHRIEVRPKPAAGDPRAATLLHDAHALGIDPPRARTARVYLIEASLTPDQLETVRARLLEDPVVERASLGASSTNPDERTIEVHPLPGVMDPAAQTVADAIHDLVGVDAEVQTGARYDIAGVSSAQADTLARRLLANPVVHAIHTAPHHPDHLPKGRPAEFRVTHVPIRELDDGALEKLSREAHLFLSLDEMLAIRDEYRALEREPTDIELETLAQTWSEHCVHKTLKARITYKRDPESPGIPIPGLDAPGASPRPGHTTNPDGSVTIDNLLKSTVARATHELIEEGVDWTLSVFVDNAGVIVFDDDHAVCVKVETHNHPSAIEPYGGAATGIGGCIRDVIGTGLAAKPIASTDVFCVAPHDLEDIPDGCLRPRRVLGEVVRGVRDYGNRMGIPTVNGGVWFDERYVGNPLVYCGCVGLMPRHGPGGNNDSLISGAAKPGDRIIALGGRTGRDGIHGATFSSAELTDTHADEFAHAVQIGNAIEEKRVLDAILRARDYGSEGPETSHRGPGKSRNPGPGSPVAGPLFNAITDCGAGGFSSAVGEMGEKLGAEVHLDHAPLKYAGLTYTEIWISEAQERMVLAVPQENVAALQTICDEEHVELADLGHFGTPHRDLILNYNDVEVGRLPMEFLHDGIPMPTREAKWSPPSCSLSPWGRAGVRGSPASPPSLRDTLLTLLSHPNIASKHWIIRQYDHEVQGSTVIKPLVGPLGRGPGDGAVIQPVPGSNKGLAIACGLATNVGDPALGGDPYDMALAAIDECVRNLVCVGADPERIAILDNFCWPSCKKPQNLASLVRAAEGCYDAAKAYRTPFVSGKDSLNNQFTTEDGRTIEIPPTLLITGIAIVPDVRLCVSSDAKRPGSALLHVTGADPDTLRGLRGSHFAKLFDIRNERADEGADVDLIPRTDPARGAATARAVADLVARPPGVPIAGCRVRAAHDISDGGLLVALAEMLIAGTRPDAPIGASIGFQGAGPDASELFGEAPSSFLLEIDEPASDDAYESLLTHFERAGAHAQIIGSLTDTGVLDVTPSWGESFRVPVEDLARAWRAPLDW
ncbi:MAG: phosphoribosylformylglycinamidine synthase subunit PurS [Phycisphaerales bacterium]